VAELELDRVLQETEEAFLLFLLDDFYALAFVAAHAAEVKRLAALALHHMHTGVAHDLGAMRALEGNLPVRMAAAIQLAVFLDGLGQRRLLLDLRDGYGGVDGLNQQLHVADPHGLAWPEPGFLDGFAIEKSAVGGIAIAQINAVMRQRQLTVQ